MSIKIQDVDVVIFPSIRGEGINIVNCPVNRWYGQNPLVFKLHLEGKPVITVCIPFDIFISV